MVKGERINSISHLIGTVAALVGLSLLLVLSARQGDAVKIVSVAVYGTAMVLLFLFSTLYHSTLGRTKAVLQKFDHASIYLFIAASYTPFMLVSLRGTWGWSLFGVVWGLAAIGIAIDVSARADRRRILPVVIYLLMGWLVLVAFFPLMRALPADAIVWLVIGGALYTVGIVFFALDGRLRYAHEIWHGFVLAGSAAHFYAVWKYVL